MLQWFATHNDVWRRASVVVALCTALVVVSSSAALHDALMRVLIDAEAAISRHSFLSAALFVALAAVTAMVTFVSVAVVVPAAVLAWGEIQSMSLLWTGWVLGGLGAYALGRLLGRPIARFIFASDALAGIEARLQQHAQFWFVLLVQLALPSEVLGYALGMGRYPLLRYVLALGIAELPYTIATVRLGASFVSGRVGLILAAGLSIALLSLAAFCVLRYHARTPSESRSTAGVGCERNGLAAASHLPEGL